MSGKNELFAIVHSLSKSECARVRSILKKSELGISLFNAVVKQEKPDNEALKKLFPDQGLSAFRSMKSWLFDRVVEILATRKGAKGGYEGAMLIDCIHILIPRNLLSKAEMKLDKAEALVTKREDFQLHLDLLDVRKELAVRQMTGAALQSEMTGLSDLSMELAAKLTNQLEYKAIWNFIIGLPRGDAQELESEIKTIESNPLIVSPDFMSLKARLIYLRILQWLARVKGKYEQAVGHSEFIVNLIEENPELLNNSRTMLLYWDFVFSWGLYLLHLKKLDQAMVPIEKLRAAFHGKEKISKWLVWANLRFLELWKFSRSRQYEEVKRMIVLIKKELPVLGVTPPNEYLNLVWMCCVQLMILGEYKEAILWLFKLLDANIHIREDLLAVGKVLILVCYYSLESFENLAREFDLDKKRKKKIRKESRFGFVIDFLSSMIKLPPSERMAGERELYRQIRDKEIPPFTLQYFDWETWILSRMENKRMMDIYSLNDH